LLATSTLRGMKARYATLALYALCLTGMAGALLISQWTPDVQWPSYGVVVFGILAALFVWQFGVQAPRVGLISMERVPQIGFLLVFDPLVAAIVCALASMVWPLVSRRYSHGSAVFGTIRALHNASMTVLMLLAAGHAYLAVGGEHPLTTFSVQTVGALIVMAVVAQVVNISIMALFFKFDGREVRRIITPAYALSDLIFVPAGVLAALLFNSGAHAALILFVALMALFVLSFNSVGHAWSAPKEDPNPLARLFNVGRVLHGARDVGELGVRILSETHSLLRFDEFYFVLVDRDRGLLDVRVHERRGERLAPRTKPIEAGMFGWVIEHAQPVLVEDYSKAPSEVQQRVQQTEKETGSFIVVPLLDAGRVLGLLSVQHTQPELYSRADLHLMQKLAEQVAPAAIDALAFEDLENYRRRLEERVAERTLEIEKANLEKERLIAVLRERSQTLERESQEDPLTGVANRRFFGKRLAAEIEVAQAINQPLVVAIADLDAFKLVNDKLGHAVGDETLRRSAALMRAHCRDTDVIARIGGDEFALLFPALELEEAAGLCEKLRHAIESHPWQEVHPTLRVSVSIGLTQWDGATEVEDLLEAADSQLYIAKLSGRNRVA
jgi:diguanylate cyclase (GGDEF)-like protein